MQRRARSFLRLFRVASLVILAGMMLVRLGPLCETVAHAATPATAAMTDCAASRPVPGKPLPSSTCSTPCVAVFAESARSVEPVAFRTPAPVAVVPAGLHGRTRAPATPPPRQT